ncbi:MAG: NADH-quinone oxidoreductase subunit N [Rubrivivax sp.]|nr:NADH-quinone oxidoreductase subunit N [Rubrivivax sp.]
MNWGVVFIGMLPENLLLLGILLLIVNEIVSDRPSGASAYSLVIVAAAAVAAAWLGLTGYSAVPFAGQFSVSPTGSLAKAAVLALALPVLLMCRDDSEDSGPLYPLLLSSLYGLIIMLSADSFLTLFLGLELMSLPVYVLVMLARRRPQSTEAALKYLVLGGAATATLLMGMTMLYGWSGNLSLANFGRALGSHDPMAIAGAAMILLAFFLKAAVVPFHTWAPDAYEGASVPVTAYMAALIKAGAVLATLRLFGQTALSGTMVDLLAVLPLASIVWGNLAAMRQDNLRRMMAYSSIAHAGYLFYAFLGNGPGRFQAVMFYLVAYGLMTLLAFAVVPRHADDQQRDQLEQLKGLFHRQPYAAIVIGLSMLSLAGIPPLPGFIGKFLIFREVMAAGYTLYAVLGLVGSYLGIYFYLRVIQFMFMTPQAVTTSGETPPRSAALLASALCLVPALYVAIFPGRILAIL